MVCTLIMAVLVVACARDQAEEAPAPAEQEVAEEPAAEEVEADATDEVADDVADVEGGYRIGVTYLDLTNPVWAENANRIAEVAPERYNATVTILDAQNDPALQVTQIENFIADGVDAIIVGAVDPAAIYDVTQRALDAGIVVMAFGVNIDNYTLDLTAQQYDAGWANGTKAAAWINEHLDGVAQVGLLGHPEVEVLIVRAQGIIDALAHYAPGAEIVIEASAVTPDVGMAAAENFLMAFPEMMVIVCIGDGGAIGANAAVMAAGRDSDEFGIFSVDATVEAMQSIANNEPIRMSVSFGPGWLIGEQILELTMIAVRGEPFESTNYLPVMPVDRSNLVEMLEFWGMTDDVDTSRMIVP